VAATLLAIEGRRLRSRLGLGYLAGLGQFVITWWWMAEFTIGAALAILGEAAFIAVACAAVPARRGWTALAVGGATAFTLAEAARTVTPFGGVPLGGAPLGQVEGPLAPSARLGGELLVMAAVAVAGVAIASLLRRRFVVAGVAAGFVVVAALGGFVAPRGRTTEMIDVALVQGGGPIGFRAVETDPGDVLERHLAASEDVPDGLDLVVWPENVIDVGLELEGTPEDADVAAVARAADAPLVAGVTRDAPPDNFLNEAVVWDADGEIADRYEKVRRVPFGEYIPGRALIDKFYDLSVIPRDAVAGEGPGVVDTDIGRLGVMISYEVFFRERGLEATRAGGELLLVPTNAASFSTSQVPAQEIAAAQLRAISHGRALVQAAPTGFSGFIDHDGNVLDRTDLTARQVLQREMPLRAGDTLYTEIGDWPLIVLAAIALAAAWVRGAPPTGRTTR
jgi:apolipoprotein N-acyltransferase